MTAGWVDCRCFLSFVFVGGAMRLGLSPCNTQRRKNRACLPQQPTQEQSTKNEECHCKRQIGARDTDAVRHAVCLAACLPVACACAWVRGYA